MVLMVICGIIDNREHKILQIAYDRISDLGYVFFTFVKKNPVQKDFLPSLWFVCQQTQYKIYFQNMNMVLWIYFLPFLQILNISAKKCRKTPILVTIFLYVPTLKTTFFWKSNAVPPKMTQMRQYTPTFYKKVNTTDLR